MPPGFGNPLSGLRGQSTTDSIPAPEEHELQDRSGTTSASHSAQDAPTAQSSDANSTTGMLDQRAESLLNDQVRCCHWRVNREFVTGVAFVAFLGTMLAVVVLLWLRSGN